MKTGFAILAALTIATSSFASVHKLPSGAVMFLSETYGALDSNMTTRERDDIEPGYIQFVFKDHEFFNMATTDTIAVSILTDTIEANFFGISSDGGFTIRTNAFEARAIDEHFLNSKTVTWAFLDGEGRIMTRRGGSLHFYMADVK